MRELESFDQGARPERAGVEVRRIACRSALSRSKLPGLDFALNPYQGCAHNCVYCYAPFVLGIERGRWSDVGAKLDLPRLLASELVRNGGTIGLGTVTDPYQPVEERLALTRRCLEVMVAKRVKCSLLTKSDLVVRDVDLIKHLPGAEVGVTITTLDRDEALNFEPLAPSPSRRMEAVRRLVDEGIDAYVLVGPVIPGVTDSGAEQLAEAISATGAKRVMTDRLRLRPGMMELFEAMPGMRGERWSRFEKSATSSSALEASVAKVAEACRRSRLAVETAF
ncbi:MAG TPA: radical SAM protein [Methanomassiliicoccales archaeon]|nr:radical SAM protein [Methanomassiliicoccales archaeon]